MLKIRLSRRGSRNRPFYRIVVSDGRQVPTASAIDELGFYNPISDPAEVKIDSERVEHWVQKGARLSPTVRRLLRQQGQEFAQK